MNKRGFEYSQSTKKYITTLNGIEIQINESDMKEANLVRAEEIVIAYPKRLPDLISFCMQSETFQCCYPDFSAEEIAEKMHMPILKLDNVGGMFTYCNHELDYDHLIDIEFSGIIDIFFSVAIDG